MFYIPFLYSFRTRFKTWNKLISWGFIYVTPLLMLSWFYSGYYGICISLLNIVLVYAAYELGYIFNDVYTIRNEKKPTLRLAGFELKYCEDKIFYIVFARVAWVFALLFLMAFFNFSYLYGLLVVVLIGIVYVLYNSIRNRFNLALHFILVNLRYTSIVFPFLMMNDIGAVMLLFPVINLLERCSEPRFELVFFQKLVFSNKKSGRYLYYFILTLCLVILFGLNSPLSFVSMYYFLYRFFSVKFLQEGKCTII
jgi:hypothetical protein